MTIHYPPGPERKKLATVLAKAIGTSSHYAGMPSASYIAGEHTISKEWILTGPDNRELVEALKQQGFKSVEETYDTQLDQSDKLTIEVPIGEDFTAAKLANLEKLVASRGNLLKKVLGADAADPLTIEQVPGALKFPWFPLDDNAMVYGQLACALVRTAMEAKRITARERPCESERFHMRTYLLKIGFIGDTYENKRNCHDV